MRTKGMILLAAAVTLVTVGIAIPVAAEVTTVIGAERKTILDALRGPVQTELVQPVEFVVDTIVKNGAWAFVIARPQKPGGAPIAWQNTVCKGDVSHLVGGLLQKIEGVWIVRTTALCPTDVAWVTWPDDYGAPRDLFAPD